MPTPSIIETEIVNRLVRGDKPKDLAAEFNIGIATVYHIRNRQAQAIEAIENKVSKHKQRITARILEKAQKQLEKRIDESDSYDELVNQIRDEYDEIINNINEQEENAKQLYKDAQWWRDAKIAKLKRLSAAELVTITKEAFHQSQVEQGKPTSLSYTADPQTTKEQLDQLLEAIKNNDGARLIELTGSDIHKTI